MFHNLKQMSLVAQVSQLQTSSAPQKPLASEVQEVKPEIRHLEVMDHCIWEPTEK